MEENIMATYTVNLDERTSAGKALLNYLKSLGVITPAKEKTAYDETLQAVREAKSGNMTRYKSFDDFKKRMYAL